MWNVQSKEKTTQFSSIVDCRSRWKDLAYFSNAYFGNYSDFMNNYLGHLNDLNLTSFPENWAPLEKNEQIVGDGIFTNQFDYQILGYAHFKNTKQAVEFKTLRLVVENVIGAVKRWKICANTRKSSTSNPIDDMKSNDKVWTICAGLYNMFTPALRQFH